MIAALGASTLTLIGTFGVERWRMARAERASRGQEVKAAGIALLTSSMELVLVAGALRDLLRFRSGLGEGVDVATGVRKPLDPLELHQTFAGALRATFDAHARLWTLGDEALIHDANQVLQSCERLLGVAGERGTARGRFMRFLARDKWTDEADKALAEHVSGVAKARARFAERLRAVVGSNELDLTAPTILG